jgi:hypothetical protein
LPTDDGVSTQEGVSAESDEARFEIDISFVDQPGSSGSRPPLHNVPPGHLPVLLASDAIGAFGTRMWVGSRGPNGRRLNASLLMADAPKFPSNEYDDYVEDVIKTRRHSGRELIIDETEHVYSAQPYRDVGVWMSPAGAVLFARTFSSGCCGYPLDGDYAYAHDLTKIFTEGSDYREIPYLPRFQGVLGAGPEATFDASQIFTGFNVVKVALSPDERFAAIVEFRGNRGPGSAYVLWVVELRSGARRMLHQLPPDPTWEVGAVSFSPDGEFILVATHTSGGCVFLVRTTDGARLDPPIRAEGAAWRPYGNELVCVERVDASTLLLLILELGTGARRPIAHLVDDQPGATMNLGALVCDHTGRFLAGITLFGPSHEWRQREGWGHRPVVIDLEQPSWELATWWKGPYGTERDIISVAWTDPVPSGPELLTSSLVPALPPDPWDPSARSAFFEEQHRDTSEILALLAGRRVLPYHYVVEPLLRQLSALAEVAPVAAAEHRKRLQDVVDEIAQDFAQEGLDYHPWTALASVLGEIAGGGQVEPILARLKPGR